MDACDQAPSKDTIQSKFDDLSPPNRKRRDSKGEDTPSSSNSISDLNQVLKQLDDFRFDDKSRENGIYNGVNTKNNSDADILEKISQGNLEQTAATTDGNELILSVNHKQKSSDVKQQLTTKRSISTPESRTPIAANLLERPKTFNTNASKTTTDSSKQRVKRKESFLQTVANVFKKKTEAPVSPIKHTGVNVQKPLPLPGTDGYLKDVIYRLKDGDFKVRWCFLRIDFFISYLDKEYTNVDECISMESVVSAQLVDDSLFDFKIDDTKLFCFEIRTTTDRFVFGTKSKQDRNHWMQKVAESLNFKLAEEASEFQRIGWIYAREGIGGTWFGAWLLLSNRKLFCTTNNDVIHMLDLRKARCIALLEAKDGDCIPVVLEQGPYMLIDCQKLSFYFQSWNLIDTEGWHSSIKRANRNGARLEDQQLYIYDVPVIVEKCINFIYLHGSLLTGIYRKAGHATKCEQIVTQFKQDAWTTQLPSDTYSGYDVAGAFKKFFSELSEPIIPISLQVELHEIFSDSDKNQRIRSYRTLFARCSKITYNTLRMLLRHLHFIVEYKEKNLMTSENLANVWGVTMLRSEMSDFSTSNAEHLVRDLGLVEDLINLSGGIFPESDKEHHHEMLVRRTWERHMANAKQPGKENFRIWIYFGSKEGECYNIEVGLHKSAKDTCEELSPKVDLPASKLILEEFILNGNQSRPIHYDEKVLDIVLKWTYWDDADRKDNYLVLSNIDKYEAYLMDSMLPAMMEVKFADRKTKQFQTCTFELSCGQLNVYKDANKTQQMRTWNMNDILWYIGIEKGRNPPTKHAITFIEKGEKQNRTDLLPFFGNVLCFSTEFTKITWVSSLWKEQHKKEFLPLAMEFLIKRCQDNQK